MSSATARSIIVTPVEVEEKENQVQQIRNGITATLDQLGLHRLESKPGRAGVGQCIYTAFGGNIDGLRVWRQYCSQAKCKIPESESTEFWLAARENDGYSLLRLQGWVREDRAWELLSQLSSKRRNDKDQRLMVGQVLFNAFQGASAVTGRSLWSRYCRLGGLSKEELEEAEKFWEEAKTTKDSPRLLKEWVTVDSSQ